MVKDYSWNRNYFLIFQFTVGKLISLLFSLFSKPHLEKYFLVYNFILKRYCMIENKIQNCIPKVGLDTLEVIFCQQ